ncbi:uncharacterized protein LOC120336578 [Styela clava]|uniref:uncharacterized protein LOC120336578 n=1 Tax=Styela clava TaxID=7725 RepID=UPI0019394CFC|nr:uncharacterized protein LOC120336578 [Styela clava]
MNVDMRRNTTVCDLKRFGETSQRLSNMITLFVTLILLSSIYIIDVDGRSLTSTHVEGSRHISHSRGRRGLSFCGARIVDALNYYCTVGIYEPQKCFVANLYFCKRRRRDPPPICRINCGYKRRRRTTDSGSDNNADFSAALPFMPTFEQPTRTTRNIDSKSKRHIHSRCCYGECSLSEFRDYCAAR